MGILATKNPLFEWFYPTVPQANVMPTPQANVMPTPQANPSGLLGNFGVNPLLQPFLSPNARSNALSMAGLQFAGDIMKGAGPSYTPRSFGQIVGGAAAPAAQTYQKSLMNDVNQALTGMKLGQLTSQAALAQRKAEALKQLGILNPTDPDYGIKRKKLFALAYPEKAAEAAFRKKNLKVVGNKKDGFYSFNPENSEWSLIKAGAGADWKAPTKFIQIIDRKTNDTLGTFPNNAKELKPGGKYYGADNTKDLQFYAVGSIAVTPKDLESVPATQKALEKDVITSTGTIAKVMRLGEEFEDKFQQFLPRGGILFKSFLEKYFNRKLSESEKAEVTKFAEFKRLASSNLNKYIKDITGAQMSLPEAERLKLDMPNPGTGLFDGDGPTVFKSKLNGVIRDLKLYRARAMHMRREGLEFTRDTDGKVADAEIDLDDMMGTITRRGVQLATQYRAAGHSDEVVSQKVKADLKTEFGW